MLTSLVSASAEEPQIPKPRGLVNDFAQVLDPGTVQYLEALIGELRKKTGAEIAVVTVDSTEPLSAFEYAMRIAEAWKPGAPGKDNGVVFLVAVKDRQMFILTGYGIEGALPDGRVGEIRDRFVVPHLRQENYADGVRAGTEALAGVIANEYDVELTGAAPPSPAGRHSRGGALIPILALIVFFALLGRGRLWPLLFFPAYRSRGFYGGSFGGGGFGGFGGGGFGGGGAGGGW